MTHYGYDVRPAVPSDVDGPLDYGATAGYDADVPDLAWLDAVQPLLVAPADLAARLENLARLVEEAAAHPELVKPASVPEFIARHLRTLATEVRP